MIKHFFITLIFLFIFENLALSNQSAINQYLKDRKLDKIEGIWYSPPDKYGKSNNVIIYKYGNSYNALSLSGRKTNQIFRSG